MLTTGVALGLFPQVWFHHFFPITPMLTNRVSQVD